MLETFPDLLRHKVWREFLKKFPDKKRWAWQISALPAHALFANDLVKRVGRPLVFIAVDKEEAKLIADDFRAVSDFPVFFLPSGFGESGGKLAEDIYESQIRWQILNALEKEKGAYILITYPMAFLEKIPSAEAMNDRRFHIKKSETIDPDFLVEWLFDLDFEKTDLVTAPGEFARSGAVVDIFSFGDTKPVRIVFDDDTVKQIRYFDIESQLTEGELNEAEIVAKPDTEKALTNLYKIFPKSSLIYSASFDALSRFAFVLGSKSEKSFFDISFTMEVLRNFVLLSPSFQQVEGFRTPVERVPYFKRLKDFIDEVRRDLKRGFKVYIGIEDAAQRNRLKAIFEETEFDSLPVILPKTLSEGFKCPELGFAFYPEHTVFNRPLPEKPNKIKRQKQRLVLQSYNDWHKGDFIVHTDYGIGIYEGLVKIVKEGRTVEAIKLRFKNDDILYVGVHALYKLTKYKSESGKPPRLHKLGSALWRRTKERTKKKIKKLAFDLMRLYAERKQQQGFAFASDSLMQLELESSFPYRETPDQAEAIRAVKKDMERPEPMDRLVCGDVGFGKTEVALRAAFKAADNGKQTAVLVPTTVLAYQHYRTFSERLKNFPVSVDYINRFRTAADRKRILRELEEGKIDIIIGTHALVSDSVKFKDLGLLIIDEEQKFGVNVKEKIKNLKKNIDVLTLTATPIPRTLQFSLMGERDLSVINTPPPNRYPVETKVTGFDARILKEAMQKELERGGQVFFVHNRIEHIDEMAAMIKLWLPEARIAVAHGKTEGRKLERIMLDFAGGKYDILVSTAIIESGLDVPNANTMIVHNAHQFGLADLHQLRGRVGRSNRKAYCYFVIPSPETLTAEAQKRMQTLEAYTALGSGFEIALRDLEIRGAGDLLGAEQSGFIEEMGFEMYRKIMQEAVDELRREFPAEDEMTNQALPVFEVTWDTDREWFIPDDYISSRKERLHFYMRLNEAETGAEINEIAQEMEDRFGPVPVVVKDLIRAMQLRILAAAIGMEKLIWKKNRLQLLASEIFYGGKPEMAMKLLVFVREQFADGIVKQEGNTLKLAFAPVQSVDKLERILKSIKDVLSDG